MKRWKAFFTGHVNDMRNIIREAFYLLKKNLGFAAGWETNFSTPVIITFCE
jgi:hypothetical protein